MLGLFKGSQPTAPDFEIVSMDVTPSQIIASQEVTVTARIANIGNAPGTFPGIVTLDGDNVAKNDLTLSAESLGAVTLKFVPPTNGEHILKFGGCFPRTSL